MTSHFVDASLVPVLVAGEVDEAISDGERVTRHDETVSCGFQSEPRQRQNMTGSDGRPRPICSGVLHRKTELSGGLAQVLDRRTESSGAFTRQMHHAIFFDVSPACQKYSR